MLFKNLFAAATLAATAFAAPTEKRQSRKLKWFGINESGAEFGETVIPGAYGTQYIWYDLKTIDQFIAQGMNMFRLNFLMERLTPTLTGSLDKAYLGNLTEQINYITSKGAYAMIQPHNYGRFNGSIITDTAGFKTWWQNVAAVYKDNDLVVFDTNNEYHDMDQQLVFDLNQAAIDGVRAAGAVSQYITPEGNSWSGAWTWISSGNGASLVNLKDPQNKLVYQMHQYLDTDGSGTHAECVSATIFSERLQAATKWLKDNKKQGVIGEFAGGVNDQCVAALKDGLDYLGKNSDVWLGGIWWAAGPWWGDYMYNMEPTSGPAWAGILPSIKSYFL
ncbi:glycoside hydrolase family 5 protein [Melanomma pulvis-pyrius CBS 109.77]|uniref:cellulase n=1 Tax=Melanomma pulvis-pyrius CBS 109.77 TaxID=1314802 RepID=A0A6A6WW01_9PLEO|nr:glycoside hydrolase family 5 protein [Melanomma pulvis-pyrius CBS 109.77]